jgi:hypothetical protein
MAARRPAQVAGLALVCPLLPGLHDVPEHRVVAGSGEIGDDVFRSYFVIQTPEMLERYERYVAPAAALAVVDNAGHALPHEQPELLRALLTEWLARVERSS